MMPIPFQSLIKFENTLTLRLDGSNDTLPLPCAIHPEAEDRSILVTFQEMHEDDVTAFNRKGKLSADGYSKYSVTLLSKGKLKLSPKQ